MKKMLSASFAAIAAVALTACAYEVPASETPVGFGNPSGSGESLTFSETDNAVRSAEQYLSTMPFSQQGLADQLVFEGYSVEDAQNAVAVVESDWNEQAVKSGQSYLSMMPMSQQELHDQLVFEKYTPDQAQFAVNQMFGQG